MLGFSDSKNENLDGSLTKDGVLGTPESKNNQNTETVLPFLECVCGGVVDPCSSKLLTSDISSYRVLVNQAYRNGISQN